MNSRTISRSTTAQLTVIKKCLPQQAAELQNDVQKIVSGFTPEDLKLIARLSLNETFKNIALENLRQYITQ